MKIIKTISLFAMMIFCSINLYSQDINSSKKIHILIYNFLTNDVYDNVAEKEKNYQYYSIIIPETISKSLNKSVNYEISREEGPLSIESEFKDKNEKTKYLKKLDDLSSKNKCDYIITGNFNVIEKQLTLRITIFDVKGHNFKTIEHESNELGVQLQETTDYISQQISENIVNFDRMNTENLNRSPFIPLYKPFSIITMGIDSGYIYILGNWNSIYNDTLYISPFINFDLINDFSLNFNFTSIESDTENKNTKTYSQIKILSGNMNICYTYRFSPYIGIAFSAGGGISKSTINLNNSEPFSTTIPEKKSFDANTDMSTYFVFNISAVTLRTGVVYKKIFYKNEPMNTGIVFAGAGIHF